MSACPQRLHVDQSTVPHHGAHNAGDMPGVDMGLKGVGHAGESLGGKADRFGISRR